MSMGWMQQVKMAPFLLFLSLGAQGFAQHGPPEPPVMRRSIENQARQISSMIRPAPVVRPDKFFNSFKKNVVSLRIWSRVLSGTDEELWISEYEKITISGHPVALKLVGDNLAVVVQFIPYLRYGNQWALIAQGQIWLEDGNTGLRYETTLQTIPVKLGEKVYYFPLGPGRAGDCIEICLELNPYSAALKPEDGRPDDAPATKVPIKEQTKDKPKGVFDEN